MKYPIIGPLKLSGNNLLDAYGNVYCTKAETQYYKECNYRGYKYYATMTDVQEKAVAQLLIYLCKQHNIPKVFKPNADQIFTSNKEAQDFKGIFLHTSVRKDKFDWPLEMLKGVQDKMVVVEKPYTKVCKDPAFDLKFNGIPDFTGIFK